MIVNVEHCVLDNEALAAVVLQGNQPIRRSTHAGNQAPKELVIQHDMPPGITVIAVDTIRGSDTFSDPRRVRLRDEAIPIAPGRLSNRIVGSIAVAAADDTALPLAPLPGEMLDGYHLRVSSELKPTNPAVTLSAFFAEAPEAYAAVMHAAQTAGALTRVVTSDGVIEDAERINVADHGIFGLIDQTSSQQGALPPLDAMMAYDVIRSAVDGSDSTVHLAGNDMVVYTKDQERMSRVGELAAHAAAILGVPLQGHRYMVADITGLGADLSPNHRSQHSLLAAQLEQL